MSEYSIASSRTQKARPMCGLHAKTKSLIGQSRLVDTHPYSIVDLSAKAVCRDRLRKEARHKQVRNRTKMDYLMVNEITVWLTGSLTYQEVQMVVRGVRGTWGAGELMPDNPPAGGARGLRVNRGCFSCPGI